jgi:integrase/recombinase XerD
MQVKELKKLYDDKLITEEKYKEKLFNLSLKPKEKKIPRRQYEGLKEEEFVELLKSYDIEPQKVILLLAYGSGLRLQEILNLQKDDFDFDSKMIKVRCGKFSKDRQTLLPKYFKQSYMQYIPFNYTKMGVQAMFLKKSLKVGINKQIAIYKTADGKERKIYKYHFHCLRHSFAVNLLKKGVPLNYVQKLLGHSNISATSTYTNIGSTDAIQMAIEKGF